MNLSSDLISQFVKITNDTPETKKETTVYGTIVKHNGITYAKLDGSERLTPVTSTTDTKDGERVTVMIKNHTATVTGNISSPAARTEDVQNIVLEAEKIGKKITEFEIAIGNKVDTEELNAERARIDALQADNVTIKENLTATNATIETLQSDNVTINNNLTAANANIEKLQTDKLDATVAEAKFASIENLEATNADLHNLSATYADFAVATADRFAANEASINNLQANKLDATEANMTYATIVDLDAERARIDDLEAEVATVDTLIFGSATGNTIQTSFSNAVISQLGDAQIKSAMIDSVSASKITSGDIITNNVRVKSEDGSLIISDETMQISDENRVRVQIGKDAAGDYSINIWDQNGNLMFSKGGITDSAIKDAIIRNDMVSDTANIAAHKLDIDSLFEEINGSSNTIKSTQIYIDDEKQTLDVAFKTITEDVSDIDETVSSQGTQISAIQGQISSKIWQQDINTAKNALEEQTETLSTQYSTLEQELDGISVTVASHTSQISNKADNSTVTTVSDKVAKLETSLSGFQSTVSETYATKTELADMEIGGRNLLRNTKNPTDKSYWQAGYIMHDDELNENVFYVTRSANSEVTISTYRIRVNPGETYTISAYVKRTANVRNIDFYFLSREEGSTEDYTIVQSRMNMTPVADTWVKLTWTFVMDSRAYEGYFRIDHNGSTDGTDATLYFTMIKMEKGDKATDWTPAPEDMATADEVESLVNRVSTAETSITQNKAEIALKASKTEVTEAVENINSDIGDLTSRISSAETTITQNANAITLRATKNEVQEAINNIEIGGRNLIVNSSMYRKDSPYSNTSSAADGTKTNPHMYMPCEIGETYTFQCCTDSIWGTHQTDGTATGWTHIYLYLMTEENAVGQYTYAYALQNDPSKKLSGRQTWTFTVPNNGTAYTKIMFRFDIHSNGTTAHTVNWWDLKAERGTKATDWTPPPEDMATNEDLANVKTRVTTAETKITQNSNSITAVASRTSTNESAISSLELTADGLTAKVNVLNSMGLDGRNLLLNTSSFTKDNPIILSSASTDGYAVKFNGKWIYSSRPITPSSKLTIQACTDGVWGNHHGYQNATSKTFVTMWLYWYDKADEAITAPNTYKHAVVYYADGTTSGRYIWNITAPDSTNTTTGNWYVHLRLNTYSDGTEVVTHNVWDVKMEEGTQATVWTPAPEDITDAAKTATNYLNFSSSGLVVGDMTASTLGKNVLIDSDSVDIRNGSTTLASFGAETITLGQNAENSTISLCDGAGTIKAAISETQTAYPKYDALELESQELNLLGRRINLDTTYTGSTYSGASSMTLMSTNSGIGSDCTVTSTGKTNQTGLSSDATDNYVNTHSNVYAIGWDATAGKYIYNYVSVYPLRTQFSQPISINGNTITGANKVLWSGGYYMTSAHTCVLSEGVGDQTNGIVLVFSEYIDGAVSNTAFHTRFVPKDTVVDHGGVGHCFQLSSSNLAYFATKYLYISNTRVNGHDNNNLTGASTCGITRTNTRFVLRYIIGV